MNELNDAASLFAHSACIAEAFVPFTKEISVIIQRNSAGESYCLPVAENIHKDHILHESIVPARVHDDVLEQAVDEAKKIADHLELVGTLAVEMFVLENGTIVINELCSKTA